MTPTWLVHGPYDRKSGDAPGTVSFEAHRRAETVAWVQQHAYGEIVVWRQHIAPGHYRYAVANHRTRDVPGVATIIRRDVLANFDPEALAAWDAAKPVADRRRGPKPTVEFDGKRYACRRWNLDIPDLTAMPRLHALVWLNQNTVPRGHTRVARVNLAGYAAAANVVIGGNARRSV